MAVTGESVRARPWLQFYDPGVPHTLSYPDVPLHAFLDRAARDHPEATATIFYNARLTYRELSELADRFAAGLQSLGVRKGDRVALVLPNCPQFVIAFYGALRAGAVVVPTNPLYTPREMTHQLSETGSETVVVLSRLYPVVKSIAAQTPTVKRVVVTNIKEYMPPLLRALFTLAKEKKEGHRPDLSADVRARRFPDLLRVAAKPSPVAVEAKDLAALLPTGGTTGVPKFALLSHRALVANTLQIRSWFPQTKEGRSSMLAIMPFFHVYGLTVLQSFAVHSAVAMILMPRFDLHEALKNIQKHRPNLFPGAPRIYVAINNSPETKNYDLRSIEACISGSAPLPVEVAEKFESLTGGKVVEGYGLTEAAPVTHCNPMTGRRKIGSVGVPLPDVDAKVVDLESGTRELGVGEVGELVVRGPNLMDGYWKRPDETALTLRNGWLYTGDIATMDADGYFTIVDRKKEMILVSGFNVYPREVEEVLYTHPAVLEGAAIGVPDPERGEVVKAFVVLKPGTTATAEDIIEHCRAGLARYKVPHEVEFRSELPKTLIGKVLRRQLADEEKAKRAAS